MAPSALGSLESINLDSMIRHNFQPDYTVRACTEVLYLRVKRSLYLAAKRATLMERSQKDNASGEQLDDEVEKVSVKSFWWIFLQSPLYCFYPHRFDLLFNVDVSKTIVKTRYAVTHDGTIYSLPPNRLLVF